MKIYPPTKFVPQILKEGEYEGHVLLKAISADERADLYDRLNFEEVNGEIKTRASMATMQKVFNAIAREMVVGVKINRIADDVLIEDFEDVFREPGLFRIFQEIGQYVINPVGLSKNLQA